MNSNEPTDEELYYLVLEKIVDMSDNLKKKYPKLNVNFVNQFIATDYEDFKKEVEPYKKYMDDGGKMLDYLHAEYGFDRKLLSDIEVLKVIQLFEMLMTLVI